MNQYAVFLISFICVLGCAQPNGHVAHDPVYDLDSLADTSTVNQVTFQVDSVTIATELLPTYPVKTIIQNRFRLPLNYLPTEHDSIEIAPIHGNGLIWTVQECYDKHRPLILTPDAIWLTICQGVSIHIHQNFDSLETLLFNENKPYEIIVRNDSLAADADQWANLVNDLSEQTIDYTQVGIYDFFVPDFSTTNSAIKMAYQINLLEAFEKAFTYVGESGCGIPSIKLEGYKKDWQNIYEHLDQLDDFGLTTWKENLKPIIQEFIASYDGKINEPFWKDIYKNAREYNGFYISGWIIKLFPYIEVKDDYDLETDFVQNRGYKTELSYQPNPYLNGTDYLMSTLSTNHFPAGNSEIDLEWRDYNQNKTTPMLIKGGFVGMEQFADKSLKPFISWAVVEKGAKKSPLKNLAYHRDTLHHKVGHWSPKIVTILQDSAIYDIKKHPNQSVSLIAIKKSLTEAVNENIKTADLDLSGNAIEFVVLSNGSLTNFNIRGSEVENEALLELLKRELINLPEPWFAATAYPKDMLRLMPGFGEPAEGKVQVNSLVVIAF